MSEHLRTIRNAWISAMITEDPDQYYDAITEEEAIYAWDAALAAHDREVKAEAWDEAVEAMVWAQQNGPEQHWLPYVRDNNPYRIESQETP